MRNIASSLANQIRDIFCVNDKTKEKRKTPTAPFRKCLSHDVYLCLTTHNFSIKAFIHWRYKH